MTDQHDLSRYAWLSIGTGVVVFALKLGAFLLTDSVGLLSDALESTVNIVAAVVALFALRAAAAPADEKHHFGHGKAEYFSALFEGLMILLAALLIIVTAVQRFRNPQPLTDVGIGLTISAVASVLNGTVAVTLIRAGSRHRSIVLTADGKHLMTDVWTSVGVIAAVLLVAWTGWLRLDPLIAVAVALNIVVTGLKLVQTSSAGLLDAALPPEENELVAEVLRSHQDPDVRFHALQTRASGRHRFVTMHVLVPGAWTVQRGHDVVEQVEQAVREVLPGTTVTTHLEPVEDPRSWEDLPDGRHPVTDDERHEGT